MESVIKAIDAGARRGEKVNRYAGRVDTFHDRIVTGWALTTTSSSTDLFLAVNGRIVKKIKADISRPDVAQAYQTNYDRFGFSIHLDELNLDLFTFADEDVQLSITIDSALQLHIPGSPINIRTAKTRYGKLRFKYPHALSVQLPVFSADFEEPDIVATLEFEGINLQTQLHGKSTQTGEGSATLVFSDPESSTVTEDLFSTIDSASRLKHQGKEQVTVACSIENGKARAQRFEIEVSDLISFLICANKNAIFSQLENEGYSRQYVTLSLALIAAARSSNYAPVAAVFVKLCEQFNNRVAEFAKDEKKLCLSTLLAVANTIWDCRLWELYYEATSHLIIHVTPASGITTTENALSFTSRILAQTLGRPDRCSKSDSLISTIEVTLRQFVEMTANPFAHTNAQEILVHDWRNIIERYLASLIRWPVLLPTLVLLDIRGVLFTASGGRTCDIRDFSPFDVRLEQIYLGIESRLTAIVSRYQSSFAAEYQNALVKVLESHTVLQRLVRSFSGIGSQTASQDETAIEEALRRFLSFSGQKGRCNTSRIQALVNLSSHSSDLASKLNDALTCESDKYKLETLLGNETSVYMSQPNTDLSRALENVIDDLTVLVEEDHAYSKGFPPFISYNAVNLGFERHRGAAITRLVDRLRKTQATILVFAPWLSLGGADACCCSVANVFATNNRVAICLTESGLSEGKSRLINDVTVLDLSDILNEFIDRDRYYILAMAIELLNPKLVLGFNSRVLWGSLQAYGNRIARTRPVGVCYFCDDLDREGNLHSYLRENSRIFSNKNIYVLSDSDSFFNSVCDELGIKIDQRIPIKFPPVANARQAIVKSCFEGTKKIMWLGRFDTQKRLDILISVAAITPEVEFHVYGFPMLDSDASLIQRLHNLSNVKVLGKYERFSDISVDLYDAMVMTSQWEGLPNVILECGVREVPIIAPAIGGISEALEEGRGFIVSRYDAVDEFAEQISSCCEDRLEAKKRSKKLRKYIEKNHTQEALATQLNILMEDVR